jgi:hypothetical protein
MRRNILRVMDLETQLVREILGWFNSRPEIAEIEFTRAIQTQVDVSTDLDYDLGTEEGIIVRLQNTGTIVLEDGREIGLEDLTTLEIAYVLDELEADNYKIY